MPVLPENETLETKESQKPKFIQIADLKSGSVFVSSNYTLMKIIIL